MISFGSKQVINSAHTIIIEPAVVFADDAESEPCSLSMGSQLTVSDAAKFVGAPGPPGPEGPPGPAGEDGQAGIPSVIDCGSPNDSDGA